MKDKNNLLILGASIATGLIVLGICINIGLKSFSDKERIVTVKGLAEQNIKATSAKINISIAFSGDVPKQLIASIENRMEKISVYLKEKGYNDFTVSDISLYDSKTYYTDQWNGKEYVKVKTDRYRGSKQISIKTTDVENVAESVNSINIDLINRDLSSDVTSSYEFPELNSIKPKLIEESTKNARIAGEQFANDSKSKLGKIKTASQGQISIAGQYYYEEDATSDVPQEPYLQKVRVVSTIVFFLED